MDHPGQRAEQMKNEYSAERDAIFVSGHASLNRLFFWRNAAAHGVWFGEFQPEIASAVQNLIRRSELITVNAGCGKPGMGWRRAAKEVKRGVRAETKKKTLLGHENRTPSADGVR